MCLPSPEDGKAVERFQQLLIQDRASNLPIYLGYYPSIPPHNVSSRVRPQNPLRAWGSRAGETMSQYPQAPKFKVFVIEK